MYYMYLDKNNLLNLPTDLETFREKSVPKTIPFK